MKPALKLVSGDARPALPNVVDERLSPTYVAWFGALSPTERDAELHRVTAERDAADAHLRDVELFGGIIQPFWSTTTTTVSDCVVDVLALLDRLGLLEGALFRLNVRADLAERDRERKP